METETGMPRRTDQALLADMDQGSLEVSRDALRVLYQRHADAVLTFLARLCRDMHTAEDILQESFLVASQHAGRFREGSARPWLLSIAASRLKSARRSDRRRERRASEAEKLKEPNLEATHDEELERALSKLPAKERAVLDLRFHSGLNFREIAEVLGVSLRTAKNWSAAGLERLHKQLDPDGGNHEH